MCHTPLAAPYDKCGFMDHYHEERMIYKTVLTVYINNMS